MPHLPGLILSIALLAAALVGMRLGWRRLHRDTAGARFAAPGEAEIAALGEVELAFPDVLYLATTRGDDDLDRVTVGRLGFRARGDLEFRERGISFTGDGGLRLAVADAWLLGGGRATHTIDRTVETGGLIALAWPLGALARARAGEDAKPDLPRGTTHDDRVASYFRIVDAREREMATAELLARVAENVTHEPEGSVF